MDVLTHHWRRPRRRRGATAGRGSANLLALPRAAGLVVSGSMPGGAAVATRSTCFRMESSESRLIGYKKIEHLLCAHPGAGCSSPFGFATPLPDNELTVLRGGFAVGGFDLAVGIVARSVIDQALGGLGERLEVVTRFTVPAAGRIVHAGTSVQTLGDIAGGSAPTLPGPGGPYAANVAVSTTGTTTTVDIGGTTRLTQTALNTFVENTDVNRVIVNQLDIDLKVGGVARQLAALNAARAMRPAIQAQILYGPR